MTRSYVVRCCSVLACLSMAAIDASAQSVLTPACQRTATDLAIARIEPLRRLACRINEGCLQVDWNILQDQPLEATLGFFRFTERAPLRVLTTNLNFISYNVEWTQAGR